MQESDIYLPIESREALNREIADLIDVLPDYESRRWVPTIAGPNPIVFDLVVAAGERFFGEELLKRDQHVLKDLSVIAGLPIDPEARQIHRIETTSGHRFGVVENGQFRLVDAKSGATLAEIAYPA